MQLRPLKSIRRFYAVSQFDPVAEIAEFTWKKPCQKICIGKTFGIIYLGCFFLSHDGRKGVLIRSIIRLVINHDLVSGSRTSPYIDK